MNRASSKLGVMHWFVVAFFLIITLFGVAGCGTFSGRSSDEADQANRDISNESRFNSSFRPERSEIDVHEVH
jgi:hypothetical protein